MGAFSLDTGATQTHRLPQTPLPSEATGELAGTSSARRGELRAARQGRGFRPLASLRLPLDSTFTLRHFPSLHHCLAGDHDRIPREDCEFYEMEIGT